MSFRKTHKNIISLFMVMLLVLSNFNLAFKNKVFAQTGPELLITEIMVRAVSGTDYYEFIEVYNNSNAPIDIRDYKFTYPSSDIDVSKIIQPKGVLVICATNTTTLSAFNAFYGTNLTEDQFVNFKITSGISNTPPKTIVLAKDTGEEVCRATYNSGDFDIKLSTTYKYPETGIDMILFGQKQQPTPGVVSPNQVPLDQNSDTQAPTITHTPITEADNTNDLIISANITDDIQILSAKVYYRKVGETAYKSITMQKNNDLYTAVIPKSELSTQGIEYYIEASDGRNTVTYPSDINNPLKVVIKEVDNVQPKVSIISPQSGEWIENKRPQISATIEDSSGLDLTTLKIYLDNADVTDKANLTYEDVEPKKFVKLEYNPVEDLAEGEHVVRIFIRDLSSLKNASDFTWNFYIGQETYNLYFGQIHAHTNYSDGLGTPEEAYDYAKNVAKADFLQ
ncbi:lamin tail domain-containing protein [Caloramator sp. Dgby_cultured_2]|uniref:lamin tail domain-containing protein n=1 Tax=Caloramator sp. Dgby_cultured_2 TaxID=3029174 RepID=UPI00237E0AA4|nr:lamin tail domain-containing protein [Caloramator sp. Dgby_cultured_2]WDU82661.1 lamin tail domain-containing protein [Caloramator sp. Dgby_cultured_2]